MTRRSYGIGLYAPAGFATEPAAIDRAVARLSALGHRVVVDPTCSARWQRFSAPDDERLAAILRMANALDADHQQKVKNVRVRPEGGVIAFEVEGAGDLTMERLAFLARSDFFQDAFGRRVIFREVTKGDAG